MKSLIVEKLKTNYQFILIETIEIFEDKSFLPFMKKEYKNVCKSPEVEQNWINRLKDCIDVLEKM